MEEFIKPKTLELAIEKGFNIIQTLITNYLDEDLKIKEFTDTDGVLQSSLQKWLREEHRINITVSIDGTEKENCSYGYSIEWYNKRWFHKGNELEINWKKYEEALEFGLQEALKLIK